MPTPLVTILDACETALAGVAPSFKGRKYLAQLDAPRRYVWVVLGADTQGTTSPGANPRPLHDDGWDLAVHCWGKDLDEALRMRQALVTVVRQQVNGANYSLGRTTVIDDDEHNVDGVAVVQELALRTPLVVAKIPDLVDDVRPTKKPTAVEFDPGTPVRGDGLLDAPNDGET